MNNHHCHCDIPGIITLSQHDKDSRICDNCDTLLEECHSITTDVNRFRIEGLVCEFMIRLRLCLNIIPVEAVAFIITPIIRKFNPEGSSDR